MKDLIKSIVTFGSAVILNLTVSFAQDATIVQETGAWEIDIAFEQTDFQLIEQIDPGVDANPDFAEGAHFTSATASIGSDILNPAVDSILQVISTVETTEDYTWNSTCEALPDPVPCVQDRTLTLHFDLSFSKTVPFDAASARGVGLATIMAAPGSAGVTIAGNASLIDAKLQVSEEDNVVLEGGTLVDEVTTATVTVTQAATLLIRNSADARSRIQGIAVAFAEVQSQVTSP